MMKDRDGIIMISDTGNDCISVLKQSDRDFFEKTRINMSAESGPHGMTVCKSGQFVFFTNSFDRSMGIFDIFSNKITHNIGTGTTPCHIAENNNKIYVTNFDSDSISVIDFEEKNGIISIETGIMPHDIISVDEKLIVSESGSDSLGIIDCSADKYEEKIGLDCSPVHIINMKFKNEQEILVAACTDFGIDVKGYICLFEAKSMKLIEKIRIGHCITDIAADSDGIHLYVADGGAGSVYKLNLFSGQVIDNLHLSGFPASIIIDKIQKNIIVCDNYFGRIVIIDKQKFIIEKEIKTGDDVSHIIEV